MAAARRKARKSTRKTASKSPRRKSVAKTKAKTKTRAKAKAAPKRAPRAKARPAAARRRAVPALSNAEATEIRSEGSMYSPLKGVTVVDLTKVLAGPLCTQYLAELGATVIKVEPTKLGDDSRGWPPFTGTDGAVFLSVNRGKRSIALDLKTPESKAILHKLVKKADVFLESNRTGAAGRLGIDYESIRKINPRIIYTSVSGYGRTGPRAPLPGYDLALQAFSGIMSITGEKGGAPVRAAFSPLDQATGMNAVIGILAALRDREATGQGRYLEVSLMETALMFLAYTFQIYWTDHKIPGRAGSAHESIAPYQVFSTADDFVLLACGNDALWQRFCDAAGRSELKADPRYATNADRVRNFAETVALTESILKGRPAAEWIDMLAKAGVPCAPINTVDRILADPQVLARHMVLVADHPRYGKVPGIAMPIHFGGYARSTRSAPPVHGQHTRDVLRDLGYNDKDIARWQAAGMIRIPDAK